MAIVTGANLLDSVLTSTGVGMSLGVRGFLAVRLQAMLDAGMGGGTAVAVVLSAASSDIRTAVPVLTNLARTITDAKLDIESSIITLTPTDIDTGTIETPVVFDAGIGSLDFMDDATILTHVVINNFTSDDRITISNAELTSYSFANDGTDVDITFNDNGLVNHITLTGVVSSSILVSDKETFDAALGFDAFA